MHTLAEPAPDSRPAYRVRSDTLWAQAREAYLGGMSGPDVCAHFGLGLAALRARAQREGWRRLDQPLPESDPDAGPEFDRDRPGVTVSLMAAFAWSHASRATVDGRCAEAWRWTRLYEQYRAMAIDDGVTGWSPPPRDFDDDRDSPSARVTPDFAPRLPIRLDDDDGLDGEFDSFDSFDSFFSEDGFDEDEPPTPGPNRAARRRAAACARGRNGSATPPSAAAPACRSRDSLEPA